MKSRRLVTRSAGTGFSKSLKEFMKELLVILDEESAYARRLSDYLSQRERFHYDIRIFTSASLFVSSLKGKSIAVLIVSEKSYLEIVSSNYSETMDVATVRILIGNNTGQDDANENYRYGENVEAINKYQSAENIYRSIINICPDNDNSEKTETDISDVKLRVKNRVQDKLLTMGYVSDNETLRVIDECIGDETGKLTDEKKTTLRNTVFYSIRGLDVLEELIADEAITEIMVNSENDIFYEKGGRLFSSQKRFDSREQLLNIIQKIVADANRTVNMSNPICDARLPDGSRINTVLEPVSLNGPTLTIRRFPKDPLTAEKLIAKGSVSEEIMVMLRKLVFAGYNILISGGTGSGKTTFLNILTSFIPKDERIITIEDSAELKVIGIDNLVRLETRNANSDGCNEITMRDLIKSALRMRPDRCIVGEVRGAEAIDMLQAFSVGADGSMSTIHANSAEDALYRLEMLLMFGGVEMPLDAIRRQISIGVDIIIQLGRLKDKSRKLFEIREVLGLENGIISTGLLYRYEGGEFIKHDDIQNIFKLERAGCM